MTIIKTKNELGIEEINFYDTEDKILITFIYNRNDLNSLIQDKINEDLIVEEKKIFKKDIRSLQIEKDITVVINLKVKLQKGD